ncbi:WecB/TagA/CpsF family glycosyltransferase [Rhizobium grahamii]|uniref:N-acetyl mannosamine transferase n=1 Tax=Rhizobium grahamii TaxID=1120045 RepID=A0A370KV89_9HYPH|nr:WecB/TagA/CpsF family glycosyltransferase [Rhizobium grahamii]RDJ15413.1 N-acetyl mannosamine transferase [Rhizobium grahamii]
MNLIANFAVLSSRRAIFDLPVCDLGWDDALVFINELLSIPVGQTSISFVNARNMLTTLRDSEYRAVLAQNLLLPDGPGLDIASKVAHGSPFPASLKAADFVPALLTFMEMPRRIGLVGSTPEAVRKTALAFRRHAPWHEFIVISDSLDEAEGGSTIVKEIDQQRLDLLIVGATTPSQQKWVHRNIRADHARLVLAVGELFAAVAGRARRSPTIMRRLGLERAYRRTQKPARLGLQYGLGFAAFLYYVLQYGRSRRNRILSRSR